MNPLQPPRHRLRRGSRLLRLALSAGLAASASCAAGSAGPAEPPPGPPVVTLAQGRLSADAEAEAAAELARARAAFEAGRWAEARTAASVVVETMPTSRVSVDALLLLARSEAAAGEVEAATLHAERLTRLLPPGDERLAEAALVQARALEAAGRPVEAVRVLLALPPEVAPTGGDADALVRTVAAGLDRNALGSILQDSPLGNPLAVPVMLAYAGRLRLAGDAAGAERLAAAALDAGAEGDDAEIARAIAEGRALPGEAPGRIAAVLPLSGSPALRAFAEGVRQGIEAAVATSPLGGAVEVEFLDDAGEMAAVADRIREAEGGGVAAILGPLEDDALQAAVLARTGGVPILSPTAYEVPDDSGPVYSLGSVDPGAPLALADWASAVGLDQVVVLHPSRGPSAEEARIFIERLAELGGSVLRTLTYEPGATSFRDQMQVVQGLRPDGLVLPIPAADVQAIASQAAFYALDTLGVQLMGTAAWGDAGVRASVSTRYTDGVITATPRVGQGEGGFTRFLNAYENHFQRTLDEPQAPALGWDAASLILRVLENGARGPGAVAAALEEVDDFDGATGVLSVEGGRILRRHDVLCVENAGLVELPGGTRPTLQYRPYAPNPETGIVPEGPGRPAGFACTPER